MRRMKIYFFSGLLITLSFAMGLDADAQGKKVQKTYNWEYAVNSDVKFAFNNYDCDLVIHTWDRSNIEYKMSVDATLRSEEDARRLDGYIEELEFSHSAGSVEFNNKFWQSRKNLVGKKTIDLRGEKTIRYSDFNISGELWIPVGCNLILTSKYSGIELEEINGRVNLNLYNDKLFGENLNNNLTISAKYSTIEFNRVGDIEADLYNTDLETDQLGDLVVVSKYSKVRSGDASRVTINSYSDKYSFGNTGDISFTDKYSDLKAEITGNLKLDCYNSTVVIAGINDVELKSKYGKYEIGTVDNLHISTSYSDNFKVQSLNTLNVMESKYCIYKIDQLSSYLLLKEGYSDKFFITETGSEFQGMKVNGKYINIQMAVDDALNYRFKANLKYPKLDIEEESMDVRIKIVESSQLEMEATKGAETEGMAEFVVNGYDVAVTFTED